MVNKHFFFFAYAVEKVVVPFTLPDKLHSNYTTADAVLVHMMELLLSNYYFQVFFFLINSRGIVSAPTQDKHGYPPLQKSLLLQCAPCTQLDLVTS